MSTRDKIISLIDSLPEYKQTYILAYAQGISADEEIDDDIFCERMYQDYLNDPDPEKDDTISFEELVKELELDIK